MKHEEELDRLKSWDCGEVCHYLGMKVRKHRQEARISQSEFAKQAGIPLRTYKRFEAHGKANLETFIEVLRAMERTQYLLMLFPAPALVSPVLALEEKLRVVRMRNQARSSAPIRGPSTLPSDKNAASSRVRHVAGRNNAP